MFLRIKKRVDKELYRFIRYINRTYRLSTISPLLYRSIKEFMLRDGKRVRPALFLFGYLGFARKAAPHLYRSAVSLELLHDFMLVHDDIIDKSDTRRGKPSLHVKLNRYLGRLNSIKFSGQDLALVIGDVMYALALHAFLSVEENKTRKENALRKLIEAAIYTGSGELIELLAGTKDLDRITRQEIYRIYDLKTANYTFASPLTIGATLAGAKNSEVKKLFDYGIYLGRAFQIKDDYLGMFGSQEKTGKSVLTDLKESKKTILIWYAYCHSDHKTKSAIHKILTKRKLGTRDLLRMRHIIISSGAVDYARNQIEECLYNASGIITSSKMSRQYKVPLMSYSRELLRL